MYLCINEDGNPSTKGTRHINANVNTWMEKFPSSKYKAYQCKCKHMKGKDSIFKKYKAC
jgi:hypothetical protein